MIRLLAQCKRRRAAQRVLDHIYTATEELHSLVLAADLDYAFADPEWQEGPVGQSHVAVSLEMRERLEALRQFSLPDLEKLG